MRGRNIQQLPTWLGFSPHYPNTRSRNPAKKPQSITWKKGLRGRKVRVVGAYRNSNNGRYRSRAIERKWLQKQEHSGETRLKYRTGYTEQQLELGSNKCKGSRSLQHNLHRLNAKVIIIQNTRAEGGVDFHSSPTCIEAERGRAVDWFRVANPRNRNRTQRSRPPGSLPPDPLINPQLGCSSKPTQLGLSREAEAGGRQTGQQFSW
jgi:hypothetical protein